MLSVLIPSYNFDCTHLVMTLLAQLPDDAEIVVGDDCSPKEDVSTLLAGLEKLNRVRVVRAKRNLGSAGMRNLLCREAKGDLLLYVDCDSIVTDPHFIRRYLEYAGNGVVCGTIKHPEALPSPHQTLRWRYERAYEREQSCQKSNLQPYQHFRTSHFLIPKSVMLEVPFDEQIKRSGYEDLLFGRRLEEKAVKVQHVDITTLNGDIEDNATFLRKTEGHMQTLFQMRNELQGFSTLLNTHARMNRLHLLWLIRFAFALTKDLIKRNLLGTNPNIRLFQFYKLGYFASL